MTYLQNIRLRTWNDLLANISVSPPYQIDCEDDTNSAIHWIEQALPLSNDQRVFSFPEKQLAYICDSIFLFLKARHVGNRVCELFGSGRSTWALVDVHHASLLFAKSICGFFGVHIYSLKGKSYILDYFPEFGSLDHRKGFSREYRAIAEPARLSGHRGNFEQKDIWEMMRRVIEVCSYPDERNAYFEFLRNGSLGSHAPIRNKILYDLREWTFFDDLVFASSDLKFRGELFDSFFDARTLPKDVLILYRLQGLAYSMHQELIVQSQ